MHPEPARLLSAAELYCSQSVCAPNTEDTPHVIVPETQLAQT